MTVVIYIVLCLCAATFAVATAVRAAWYARAPMHLRWELYPVPHEAPGRAAHGGSHFEEAGTMAAPVRHHWGTMKALAAEVLTLKALGDTNRPLWWRSYPFHVGLYLLVAAVPLVAAEAALTIWGPAVLDGGFGTALGGLVRVVGLAGVVLTPAGAAALLHRRLTDPDLRASTTPGDLFNLAAFIVALTTLGLGFALRPAGTAGPLDVAVGLLTWSPTLALAPVAAAGVVLSALLAAYIPFTHMSHFVGKYFTYHAVRWDDAANRPGGSIEKTMAEYLTYRPTWGATHVGADGTRTWADIAASAPPSDKTTR